MLLNGYVEIIRCDRTKGGGGVACFAKPDLKVHHEREFYVSDDIQMVTVSFKDTKFVGVYRAPGSGLVSQGSSLLAIAKIKELMQGSPKFVLMGDLNLKGLGTEWRVRNRQGTQTRTNDDIWAEFAAEMSLDQLVKTITRKPESTIDVVLATQAATVDDVEADFDRFHEFDHAGIIFTVETDPEIRAVEREKFRETEEGWEQYLETLRQAHLGLYMHAYNMTSEDKLKLISYSVLDSYENSMEKYTSRPRPKKGCKWQSKDLKRSKESARRLLKTVRNEPEGPRLTSMREKLKEKQEANNLWAAFDRWNYESEKMQNAGDFYEFISSLDGPSRPMGPLRRLDGSLTTDPGEMANMFNKFLTDQLPAQNIPRINWDSGKGYGLHTIYFTPDMIVKAIRELRKGAAPGPDGITVEMLYRARYVLAGPLAAALNQMMQERKIPDIFRIAKVGAIHKKKSRAEMANYRPISMTSHLCKVWEHIVREKMVHHVERIAKLSEKQFGFREKRGVEQCVVDMQNYISELIEVTGGCHVFSFDLKKAFDLVNQGKLLELLWLARIRGDVGATVESWFRERCQYVQIQDQESELLPVSASIVQGSKLGPFLWLLYIQACLDELPLSVKHFCYADDLVLVISVKTDQEVRAVNEAFKAMTRWATRFDMTWGADKTQMMVYGEQKEVEFEFGGVKLTPQPTLLNLGVTLSDRGTSEAMISARENSVRAMVAKIRQNLRYKTENSLSFIFKTWLAPKLYYASVVWHNHKKKEYEKMYDIWMSFWRLAPRRRPPDGVLAPRRVMLIRDLLFMKKWHDGKFPMKYTDYFVECSKGNRSSTDRKLVHSKAKHPVRVQEFTERVVWWWNKVPPAIRQGSPTTFKRHIEEFIAKYDFQKEKYVART